MPGRRASWLEQVPHSSRAAAGHLYEQFDALLPIRAQAEKDLVKEAHREFRPGVAGWPSRAR